VGYVQVLGHNCKGKKSALKIFKKDLGEAVREGDAPLGMKKHMEDVEAYPNPKRGGSEEHHLATNKNSKSTANGGPWTPIYKDIFGKAGLDIDKGAENLVDVIGHQGPHPKEYHEYVFDKLSGATEGLKGGTQAYKDAVTKALGDLKTEATTSGSQVNKWITKKQK
jgi:hypothetical protein